MTHHPHVHGIVPGGSLSLNGQRWVACRQGFFLPVRVLSRQFRRVFLEKLCAAHQAGKLQRFGEHANLADPRAFAEWLKPLRQYEWVVYAKRPFAGPDAVLAYLSRYTHRVAIANTTRRDNLMRARKLLMSEKTEASTDAADSGHSDASVTYVCPDCGAPMLIIETFERGQMPRAPPVKAGES